MDPGSVPNPFSQNGSGLLRVWNRPATSGPGPTRPVCGLPGPVANTSYRPQGHRGGPDSAGGHLPPGSPPVIASDCVLHHRVVPVGPR